MPKGVPAKFQEIDGVLHKECFGPYHKTIPYEKRWVPVDQFAVVTHGRPSMIGKPQAWCKSCASFSKTGRHNPFIPREQFSRQLEFCIARLGIMETCERTGISQANLWAMRNSDTRKGATLKNVKAIYSLWGELKRTGERRSPGSIHHGAKKRGKEEQRDNAVNGRADPLVVSTEQLAQALEKAMIEMDMEFEDYWEGRSIEHSPGFDQLRMSGRQYLLEKTGYDARTLHRVISRETKFTSLSIADALLTAAGLSDYLAPNGRIQIVPNPGWNQEDWQVYMEAQE